MINTDYKNVEKQIEIVLQKNGKDFMTPLQIKKGLPRKVRDYLGIRVKSTTSEVSAKLNPYLGKRLEKFRGPRCIYIGRNLPLKEFIYKKILEKPELTSKRLAASLPMIKKDFIFHVNCLVAEGKITCSVNHDHRPYFRAAPKTETAFAPGRVNGMDDRASFKRAYDQVGEGGSFVRIYRIREFLGWSRERFDNLLAELRRNYTIQLHGGDPSALSEQQIIDSFTDEKGRLRITLTWRGGYE